jgi:hypothetical protein
MDKLHRRYKKNIRRNAKVYAEKCKLAFANGRDKREWINDIVRNHPAIVK